MNEPEDLPGTVEADPAEMVFEGKGNSLIWGILSILGGCGMLLMAVLGFIIALIADSNVVSMQMMTTLPTLLAIGLLTNGLGMVFRPCEIVVDAEGITVDRAWGFASVTWEEIAWSKSDTHPLTHVQRLTLYNAKGKTLLQVGNYIERFQRFAKLVNGRVNTTENRQAETVRAGKARWSGLFVLLMGLLFLVGGGFLIAEARYNARAAVLLEAQGTLGVGEVVEWVKAPNGRTCRLHYKINVDGQDTQVQNVEVETGIWEKLKETTLVPVMYVPDEPNISRLVVGQVESDDFVDSPMGGYVTGGLGIVMGLAMLAIGAMMWLGWDIGLDSESGKFRMKKFGESI